MASEYSRGDAVRWCHTGAAYDGGAQPDPSLSLGGYMAVDVIEHVSLDSLSGINGLRLEFISGAVPAGDHYLDAAGIGNVRFKASDGSYGESVAIAMGERKILWDGTDPSRYVKVNRYASTALAGLETARVGKRYNNAVGMTDVENAKRVTGEVKVRCIAGFNGSAYAATDHYIWIEPLGASVVSDVTQLGASGTGTIVTTGDLAAFRPFGWARVQSAAGALKEIVYYVKHASAKELNILSTDWRGLLGTSPTAGAADDVIYPVPGIKMATEAPTADLFSVADTENDTSEISGFAWNTGITKATGLTYASIPTLDKLGLWIWLEIPPIADNTLAHDNSMLIKLNHSFVAVC